MDNTKIRNFSIIAHIDHGKSTLADRILEYTGAIDKRQMKDQLLDSMDIERERGITIKLNAVRLNYNGYILNLIDTPGHVDFSYEVSRSLAACEGAVLVVDATQGIEAQTLANVYLALENDLEIIPVINKIDLPSADIPKVERELYDTFGFKSEEIIKVSAKTGAGIPELVSAIIERIPAPEDKKDDKLKCLIFDSYFDYYRGVVILVRVMSGTLTKKTKIRMMSSGISYDVVSLGYHTPFEKEVDSFIEYIDFLHQNNVDAILVQDIGMLHLIRSIFPNLEIHASTQMNIHNIESAKLMKKIGVKRVVLARETPLELVKEIKKIVIDVHLTREHYI